MKLIDTDKIKDGIENLKALFPGIAELALDAAITVVDNIPAITIPSNGPLTLDELRKMDGEPVWAILEHENMVTVNGYALVEVELEDVAGTSFRLMFENYGADGWLAYRRKPVDIQTK